MKCDNCGKFLGDSKEKYGKVFCNEKCAEEWWDREFDELVREEK